MSRNSPIGHPGARAPLRRNPAEQDYQDAPNGQAGGHWPPQPGYGQGQGQGYYFPQAAEPEPNYGYAPPQGQHQPLPFNSFPPQQPAGHYPPHHAQAEPQWGQRPDLHAPDPNAHDPNAYDLGSYMPNSTQGYAQPEPPPFGTPHPAHGYAEHDGDDYDDQLGDQEFEDEPPRSRRGLMIIAALVGAIGLGGALAYSYKSFIASSGGRAPVIKVTDAPNKVRPVTPGGREFAHTDKKLLNKLDDGGPRSGAGASEPESSDSGPTDDPNAPRKVRIIPITPGGQAQAASPPSRPPLVAVPGMMLETSGAGPSAAQRAQVPQATQAAMPARAEPPPVAAQPPVAPPARVASAPAAPRPVAEPAAAPKKIASPPVKAPVPKREVASVATSGAGFVAVLSSQKSRMDALKAFADLQQKYGDVLAAKTPDVQEANLGDKGVWYRAVVGPPGSREAASGVCGQLKSVGYSSCWVTAY